MITPCTYAAVRFGARDWILLASWTFVSLYSRKSSQIVYECADDKLYLAFVSVGSFVFSYFLNFLAIFVLSSGHSHPATRNWYSHVFKYVRKVTANVVFYTDDIAVREDWLWVERLIPSAWTILRYSLVRLLLMKHCIRVGDECFQDNPVWCTSVLADRVWLL